MPTVLSSDRDLGLIVGESVIDAKRRFEKIIKENISDGFRTEIAQQIRLRSSDAHYEILLEAYRSACVSYTYFDKNGEVDLKFVVLPLIIYASDESEVPNDIDQNTAALIQRAIHTDYAETYSGDEIYIPTNMLLRFNEYQDTDPGEILQILLKVSDVLRGSSSMDYNFIEIFQDRSIKPGELSMHSADQVVAVRLFPLIQVRRRSSKSFRSSIGVAVRETISSLISFSSSVSCSSEAAENVDQVYGPTIYALSLMSPINAEDLLQNFIDLHWICVDSEAFVTEGYGGVSSASLVFAPLVGILSIDLTCAYPNHAVHQQELSLVVSDSPRAYSALEILETYLFGIGFSVVNVEVIGADIAGFRSLRSIQ